MSENTSSNLKKLLFDTLNGLIGGSVDIQTAKAISITAQTILNAAKVEIEFARLCEKTPENWLNGSDLVLESTSKKGISHPRPGVTVHKLT